MLVPSRVEGLVPSSVEGLNACPEPSRRACPELSRRADRSFTKGTQTSRWRILACSPRLVWVRVRRRRDLAVAGQESTEGRPALVRRGDRGELTAKSSFDQTNPTSRWRTSVSASPRHRVSASAPGGPAALNEPKPWSHPRLPTRRQRSHLSTPYSPFSPFPDTAACNTGIEPQREGVTLPHDHRHRRGSPDRESARNPGSERRRNPPLWWSSQAT